MTDAGFLVTFFIIIFLVIIFAVIESLLFFKF